MKLDPAVQRALDEFPQAHSKALGAKSEEFFKKFISPEGRDLMHAAVRAGCEAVAAKADLSSNPIDKAYINSQANLNLASVLIAAQGFKAVENGIAGDVAGRLVETAIKAITDQVWLIIASGAAKALAERRRKVEEAGQ